LSDVIASQWEVHAEWNGIVPNLAARAHEDNLPHVLERAVAESGLPNGLDSIDAIAVAAGPGLAPCLKVGVESAKKLSRDLKVPLVAVNHLEGHVLVPRLTCAQALEFPFLVLLVSGGHCMLLVAEGVGKYKMLGQTLDDSVGEAYDKAARTLKVPHFHMGEHGGVAIERLALEGDPKVHPLPIPMQRKKNCDFSFSGLKTALLYSVREVATNDGEGGHQLDHETRCNFAASFQHSVAAHLKQRCKYAMEWCAQHLPDTKNLVVCGGVAANKHLRATIDDLSASTGFTAVYPPPRYCTDNGVMIAHAGVERLMLGLVDDVDAVDLVPRWPLGPKVVLPEKWKGKKPNRAKGTHE
jgi:tRNA threonylcarbamoyl adenosine modification protein TsaD